MNPKGKSLQRREGLSLLYREDTGPQRSEVTPPSLHAQEGAVSLLEVRPGSAGRWCTHRELTPGPAPALARWPHRRLRNSVRITMADRGVPPCRRPLSRQPPASALPSQPLQPAALFPPAATRPCFLNLSPLPCGSGRNVFSSSIQGQEMHFRGSPPVPGPPCPGLHGEAGGTRPIATAQRSPA